VSPYDTILFVISCYYTRVSVPPSKLRQLAQVGEVFTPGSPVGRYAIFAGRLEQIMEIITATRNRGQHVVLYGERGVGKTSLANVLTEVFGAIDDQVLTYARINCNTGNSFDDIWSNAFRELKMPTGDRIAPWTPEEVRSVIEEQPRSLIVIDELDRLDNDEALTLIADTIKTLSDHATHTTIVLVGVADSVDELIGDHQSIERALVQIPMPRMLDEELAEIIDKGTAELEMTINGSARKRIARLSEGLPHYTHLLSLQAFQQAIMDDRVQVIDSDVDRAISAAVDKAQHSIKSAYQKATRSVRPDSLFAQVLLACAMAPKDELGFFTAGSVRAPMSMIMGRRYEIPAFARHLNQFTGMERGPMLTCTGIQRKQFYRFQNPMLQPYVILMGLSAGLITEKQLIDQPVLPVDPSERLPLS
jgi:Cdc6-like AAA superfamily ATPase